MFKRAILTFCVLVWTSGTLAVPVTINMTADNAIRGGGLCVAPHCGEGTGWSMLSDNLPHLLDWTNVDSFTIDLGTGTHFFAWNIFDSGGSEGLLAEILWDGNANRSSSSWEVYNQTPVTLIEPVVELGVNLNHPIWGTRQGIDTSAQWIWASHNNGSGSDEVWIRTSITIAANEVSEPGVLSLLLVGFGLLGLRQVKRAN